MINKIFEDLHNTFIQYKVHKYAKKEVVLVDLMHGNLEFLLRTLMIASSIRSFTGMNLIGILGNPGVVARSAKVDVEENKKIAEAFGISTIILVPDLFQKTSYEDNLVSKIEELALSVPEGERIPVSKRIELSQIKTKDKFAIGRIILETFMRSELLATVTGGGKLSFWGNHVIEFDEWIVRLLENYKISTFVTGHIDYSPWGHIAERLVRSGGRTVYFRCDIRVPINFIDDLDEDETLNGRVRRAEALAFSAFEQISSNKITIGMSWLSLATCRFEAVRKGLSRNWRWSSVAQDNEWQPPFDSKKKTYVAFAHTFTDQPMADTSLFIDHFDWLESLLNHAVQTKQYNLIVKMHPLDLIYDSSGAGEYLINKFGNEPNIHITRDQISQENLAKVCAAGLTVRGTPGIEMSALGLPMILAGRGPYSDIGFCLQPITKEDYFSILEQGPPFPIDMTIQAPRARMFHAFDRFWSAPASFSTPVFAARDVESTWKLLEESLQSVIFETDPLRIALERAWPCRNSKVISIEIDFALKDRKSTCHQKI